uniref:Uncharacterized protein n=1 Tax=Lepeophtheirus salmonis TaxID=72036 RepID=A0A0K2UAV9_LEPSM
MQEIISFGKVIFQVSHK